MQSVVAIEGLHLGWNARECSRIVPTLSQAEVHEVPLVNLKEQSVPFSSSEGHTLGREEFETLCIPSFLRGKAKEGTKNTKQRSLSLLAAIWQVWQSI